MAISDITISQDNVVNGSNLLPIHSTVTFLADVTYSGLTPDVIHVEVRDDTDTLIDTWKAIPYKDLLATVRQFAFVANDPVKSTMLGFDDFFQLIDTLEYAEDITKVLKIRFVDPDDSDTYDEIEFTFIHGAAQFGEYPNLDSIFNNETDEYLSPKDDIVYVYFYNDDTANVVDVNEEVYTVNNAVDFNDDQFVDFNDDEFTIETL
jgi:hypothetical protein